MQLVACLMNKHQPNKTKRKYFYKKRFKLFIIIYVL